MVALVVGSAVWPGVRAPGAVEQAAGPTAAPASQASNAGAQPTAAPAASGAPQKGGTLEVAFNADPETLDPHISTALLAARVLALIHDNLINRDYDGSFKPGLADKWDMSPDGKVYTSR